ncbi:DNA translocase FtsK 4TM domain-containing protein [Candidatus Thioglobus sp.]|nr:DNA translocase FtsK [Candidatus Thioglobus sp.]MDA9060181.1 DNA translocase FtsK 4TM domain-containing protein [Candidatus Thioglobus sp.]
MKKNNKRTSTNTPINNPRSKIASESIFIMLLTLGVVFLISLVTYSPDEDPWTGGAQLVKPVINNAGMFGAYLSDISIGVLGYVSYIIPIALIWLGYNFHRDANKERSSQITFLLRLTAFLVMLFFTAALAHQFAPEIKIIEGLKDTFLAGGWIGMSMHDLVFYEIFGSSSTIIYIGIIFVSFSIASSASWRNISTSLFKKTFNRDKKTTDNNSSLRTKPEIISPTPAAVEKPQKTEKTEKPQKTEKTENPQKTEKTEKPKKEQGSNLYKSGMSGGLPSLSLLDDVSNSGLGYTDEFLVEMGQQVEIKLKDFGFDVTITAVTPGPVVTQFEISLAPGIKVSQIMNLNKDLARALLVESVRIVDVIPGKPVIGLEIPNNNREMIGLKEILSSEVFTKAKSTLSMGLGKDINGLPIVVDLAKMPHLLVAGATGMGKSVGLNAIILSILYKASPEQVRFIMIDPKIVELASYADIPHLLTPVVTNMNEAASALWWCVNEMERRYSLLAKFSVRNIESFNEKQRRAQESGKPLLDPSFNPDNAKEGEKHPELESLPLIVIVIDEYADMLGALAQEDRAKSKRVEGLIVRIAQKARAAGIHLIVATQRPSVDVITGLIKSNIPTRVSFKVSSKTDSRTILDQSGAEQLLGMGDMLYMAPGMTHLTRVHGAFVEDSEILRVVKHLKKNSSPNYLEGVLKAQTEVVSNKDSGQSSGELDPLFDEAVQIVTSTRRASISSLQRRMRIGYNRAARIIEDMESSGIVSSMNSAGNRDVLAPEPIDPDET